MNDSPGSLDLLSNRVDELEKRVYALEHPGSVTVQTNVVQAKPQVRAGEDASSIQAGNLFPALGKALLGIAGAYLLRAVAESGSVPQLAVSSVAAAYAFAWLIWAARPALPTLNRFVYASTSVLILMPMLWENTLHFQMFRPALSAGILAAFATLSIVLDLRCAAGRISWLTLGAASLTNAALAFATHDVMPFLFSILVTLAATDCVRFLGIMQPARPIVALVADVALWGMIFIYSGPESARGEYRQLSVPLIVSPVLMLFLLEGASITITAIVRLKRITIFEALQAVLSFLLAIWGVLAFGAPRWGVVAGAVCVIISAGLYACAYNRLLNLADQRNFQVLSAWAAGLLVIGAALALPRGSAAVSLAVSGLAAYLIATRLSSSTLALHGAVYLVSAAFLGNLPLYLAGTLAGSVPLRIGIGTVAVLICSVLIVIACPDAPNLGWKGAALHLIPLFIVACTLCASLVHGIVFLSGGGSPLSVHHLAFVRTLVISMVTLCMAFGGSHTSHALMKPLAYGALVILAAKLLLEDLRHGHMEFTAASIFVFAVTLLAVPRLLRMGRAIQGANSPG